MSRAVYIDERPPDDGERYVSVPKGNDRMWAVTVINLRRGKRETKGTATIWRLRYLVEGVAKRYPNAVKSPFSTKRPMTFRVRRGGPITLVVEPLSGPVASMATKH